MYEQQFNPYAANIAVVKDYFKKGRILAMGLLKALAGVLSIVTSYILISNSGNLFRILMDWYRSNGIDMNEYLSDYGVTDAFGSGTFIVSAVITVIVTAVPVLGYILAYVKSRNQSPDASPEAGVTILWVLSILSLIGVSAILGFFLLILGFAAVLGGSGTGLTDGADGIYTAVVVILFIVFAIAAFVALFIAINRVRFYGSVRKSMTTVELQRGGAAPYGVMCVIGAVFSGLSLLSTLTSMLTVLPQIDQGGALTAIYAMTAVSSVLNFAMLILDAVIALGYKKHIDAVKFGYNNTPYGSAPAESFIPAPGSDYAPAPDERNPYTTRQTTYNDGYQMSAPAQQAAYCPNCGAPTESSAAFCGNCGTRLS